MMVRRFWQAAICLTLFFGVQSAKAGQFSLADWCFSINGNIDTCNGGANAAGAPASFDTTLEPDSNGLGSATFIVPAGAGNSIAFYADYDASFATYGSFDDSAAVVGFPPSDVNYSVSYEVDDPNSGNLFNDFAAIGVTADSLGNFNNVGTASGPPYECCDVAFALAITDLTGSADPLNPTTVTFQVSTLQPATGPYIKQTNTDTGDTLYLNVDVSPEPSTFALGLGALLLLGCAARVRRVRA